jgi:predicted Rossmann-fold nucleotide-binding protein
MLCGAATSEDLLMQIFVSGTWNPDKARPYSAQALELGARIAAAGHDLACGPGTGVARYVIDGFRQVPQRGRIRYYLPAEADMRAVGEEVMPGADEIEHTGLDYPMRNLLQVKRSDGLFVLTGGDGALEEIIAAVVDYRVPVAVVDGAGAAAAAVAALLEVYPKWHELIERGPDVMSLIDPFLARVGVASASRG